MRATLAYDETTERLTVTGADADELRLLQIALQQAVRGIANPNHFLHRLGSIVGQALLFKQTRGAVEGMEDRTPDLAGSMEYLQQCLTEAQRVGELLAAHPDDEFLRKDLNRIRAAIRFHQGEIRRIEANPHLQS